MGQPTFGGANIGATVQSQYMGRTMKCYPIHETEISTISMLNTASTVLFELATAAVGYATSILSSAIFYQTITPAGQIGTKIVAPALLVFAAIVGVGGVLAIIGRQNAWGRIKAESYPVQAAIPSPQLATLLTPAPQGEEPTSGPPAGAAEVS